MGKICYDNTGNVPYKERNFNTQTFGKMFSFVICMTSRHLFQTKLLKNRMFNFVSLLKYKRQMTSKNCVNLRSEANKIKQSILIIIELYNSNRDYY